ncbi:Olfactory receptor 9G4 [Heterocephalus glaber]|uniref:Olfactory receptor 9G4 n=1 Tax=Heterocephalus glaber TaxID=10181 RepID=G5AK62_HETGA|nr:Olfactory receptor 9G4 [Heterocephalus glaber]
MDLGNRTVLMEFILLGISADPHWQLIIFAIFLMLYLATLSGNLTLVVLIRIDPRLHTPMYFFIGSLSFLDFWYTSVYTPKILANCVSQDKRISLAGCGAQFFFSCFAAYTECYLLAAMAYDRYIAIGSPLLYSDTRVYVKILSSLVGFTVLSCLLVILISYFKILLAILRIRSASGRRKAFSTCASHLVSVTLFYGSLLFVYSTPSSSYSLERDKVAALFYTIINPLLNPLIYSLRNKDVKEAFRKVMQTILPQA